MLCCLSTLSIQRSKQTMHWIVYAMLFVDTVDTKIKACNAFNAICWSSRYKTHSHISAHHFLNIQPIFNLQKVLESWDWGLFNHTIQYYICWHCQHKTRISNAFNAMYIDTVNTKDIYTFLPITFLIFNWFSIHKKFWKAETKGFSTIPSNTIYVDTVNTRHKYF